MNNQHPQQMGSGLARYRSAPSSFFDTILNGGFDEDQLLFNPHQTHTIFSKFVGTSISSDAILQENTSSSDHFQTQSHQQLINSPFLSTTNNHSIVQKTTSTDYSTLIMYNNQATSGTPISAAESNNDNSSMENSGGGLIRHSSSPAGFFANLGIQKAEFGAMRGMDNSGHSGNTSNAQGSFSSAIKFKRHIDFSSKNSSSSSGMMAPISKIGKKRSGENNPGQGDGHFVEDRSNNGGDYVPGFSTNSWNNSQMMSDDFFQGFVDNNDETFTNTNILDTKNNEGGKRHAPLLSHRHSLPASSAEENLLEDSVPCKIRAKRGFATHPRSIAERVRRTNISNRIKKLQVLVPNMEKQTNTADMLDLAVDYIKDLQRQVKKLSDNGAKCKCMAKEKS